MTRIICVNLLHFVLGFWGTVLCISVVLPLAYWLPGDDHGSYEDIFRTWNMMMNSTNIQICSVLYFLSLYWYAYYFRIAHCKNIPQLTVLLLVFKLQYILSASYVQVELSMVG